ncbi:TIGR02301 family protein [Labrys sp. KB_33_2]|uniref:TIGR02301 family protein n=1 Tax=Labrys sp. KB_33_2 TaxID=3237479 RepID=UPI003F8DB42D
MSGRSLLPAVLLVLAGALSPGSAQTPPPKPVQPSTVPAAPQIAPYEPQLLRLAELMGALHYLRGLCGFADAGAWRDKMNALAEAQGFDEAAKARFAGAFNRGYRSFSESYRSCNEAAGKVIDLYLEEGSTIIKTLEARYGR